jgi:uroporphyrinogen-III synthase
MERPVNILCTRPIDQSLINSARSKGNFIDVLSFIETTPLKTITLQQEIEDALGSAATVVFTSMNAVEAVAAYLDGHQPQWKIYSIGTTTDQLINKYFGKGLIAGTAFNAADLAALIVKDRLTEKLIFFCGNQRRDELPAILRNNNIAVTEIEVYQTTAVPHKIDKAYDGILFFSPSAAESFFSNNTVSPQTILFAIGNTTADAIKSFSDNKIIIADTAGKENLVKQMIAYFGE